MKTCTECDGLREVMAPVRRNYRGVDPPMMQCPECDGRGEVDDDGDSRVSGAQFKVARAFWKARKGQSWRPTN